MSGVVTVIGHVDHGKTSLVRALTGIETDRLKEEQDRGLSIALGFAHTQTRDGTLNLIDAPGHKDFLRTTVSALSGTSAVLVVVSAVEGVMPQTREHVQIASLLGIKHAVFVITKIDLVGENDRIQVKQNLTEYLSTSSFNDSAILHCSAQSGEGMRALNAELDKRFKSLEPPSQPRDTFLSIDRVFSKDGSGTVVAGTLLGGSIHKDAEVILHPNAVPASVRGMQVNGGDVEIVNPGNRVAINLRGVSSDQISKGDVLATHQSFAPSSRFDVVFQLDANLETPIKHMAQVQLLIGTAHLAAKVQIYDSFIAGAGQKVIAQLRLEKPSVSFAGQHFVLQHPSNLKIIGGGRVLDPNPAQSGRRKKHRLGVLKAADKNDAHALARALADSGRGVFHHKEFDRVSNSTIDQTGSIIGDNFVIVSDELIICKTALEQTQTKFLEILNTLHNAAPIKPNHAKIAIARNLKNIPEAVVATSEAKLLATNKIKLTGSSVCLANYDPVAHMTPDQIEYLNLVESKLRSVELSAIRFRADEDWNDRDYYELLLHSGKAVRLKNYALKQELLIHTESIEIARDTLREAYLNFVAFSTGEAREILSTSRRVIVPLLEYFDAMGWTVRESDQRKFASI